MATTQNIRIASYMVDMRKKLRISSFMEIAQQIAEDDSEAVGFGYNDLMKHHDVWILSRMSISITRLPEFKEWVTLKTWHVRTDGPYFIRKYELHDERGSLLLESDSAWAIMNLDRRTVVRPSQYEMPDNTSAPQSAGIPQKIRIPHNAVIVSSEPRNPRYSDVDYNSHVNNVKYLVWALDSLGDIPFERDFSEVSLNFNHEMKRSDTAEIHVLESDGILYVSVGNDDRQAFAATFK